MGKKLSDMSPLHSLCFGTGSMEKSSKELEESYFLSNIDRVTLGGGGQVANLDRYHTRNGLPYIGGGITQIIPSSIERLFERDQVIKNQYGWAAPSLLTYEAGDFRAKIMEALRSQPESSKKGFLMPFEDSQETFDIAESAGLKTLNQQGAADLLNDKVKTLTGEAHHYIRAKFPEAHEVESKLALPVFLYDLNNHREFEDSLLCIKSAFSASGCGIFTGTYEELKTELEDSTSELSEWVDKIFADDRQSLMVQEYYAAHRVVSSPGVQFCINDNDIHIIGASRQDLAEDGVTHLGNTFDKDLLQDNKIFEAVESAARYAAFCGFKGIMGVDLLIYKDDSGNERVAFMEYNARNTGGVPAVFAVSMVTDDFATNRNFISNNNIYVGSATFDSVSSIITSPEFMPDNGEGFILVSAGTLNESDPANSKIQGVFLGENPILVQRRFTEALRLIS